VRGYGEADARRAQVSARPAFPPPIMTISYVLLSEISGMSDVDKSGELAVAYDFDITCCLAW
jgi:hypothetical protein